MLFISAAYAVTHAVSVRPYASVCLSATFVDSVETNRHTFEIFSPSGRHTILVFSVPKVMAIFRRGASNGGVKCMQVG